MLQYTNYIFEATDAEAWKWKIRLRNNLAIAYFFHFLFELVLGMARSVMYHVACHKQPVVSSYTRFFNKVEVNKLLHSSDWLANGNVSQI